MHPKSPRGLYNIRSEWHGQNDIANKAHTLGRSVVGVAGTLLFLVVPSFNKDASLFVGRRDTQPELWDIPIWPPLWNDFQLMAGWIVLLFYLGSVSALLINFTHILSPPAPLPEARAVVSGVVVHLHRQWRPNRCLLLHRTLTTRSPFLLQRCDFYPLRSSWPSKIIPLKF